MNIEEHVSDMAEASVGNWKKFGSFSWSNSDVEDVDNCCIINLTNRDSGLLEKVNAKVIIDYINELNSEDCWVETHSHWAVGWVKALVIRVYKDGKVTEAFDRYARCALKLEDYPILDESKYWERLFDEQIKNINNFCGRYLVGNHRNWASEIHEWLSDRNRLEDVDGYIADEDLYEAMKDLELCDVD